MELTEFWTICGANAIPLDVEQLHAIERYANEIVYWNERVNMISRKDCENVYERHILHSLMICKYAEFGQKSWVLDIGTGGGFPGIPLAIARPDLRILLTDSIAKKVKMTEMFASHTGRRDVKARCVRVEELQKEKDMIGKFDTITARAVAPILSLMDWSFPLLKKNGQYVLLKGGNLDQEISDAQKAYPFCEFTEHRIDCVGYNYFAQEEKKVIVIKQQ